MGLVSTWLNGIGLRSVVPTFEAAGIVSPSHLADLDVSYFESLGVTDPDDRRKLFYLVQRIKMAVNKKGSNSKGAGSGTTTISVEERVDAVISENFVNETDDNNDNNNNNNNDGDGNGDSNNDNDNDDNDNASNGNNNDNNDNNELYGQS